MARTSRPSATEPAEGTALFGYKEMRRKLGGISQSLAEQLVARGPERGGIESLSVGAPGSQRGRRMFTDAHIAAFIERREQARRDENAAVS